MARRLPWLILLCSVSLTLGGCLLSRLTPDEVMAKFSQASAGLASFHYTADLKLTGNLPIHLVQEATSVQLKFAGDVDNQDPNTPQFTVQANLAGISAQGPFALAGELVNLADYTYFRLTNLALPTLLPVSLGTDSRWYKIRHVPRANPNESKLGVLDGATFTPEQLAALETLIATTPVLEVSETLPDATVSGQRSYHYRTSIKPEAITSFAQQIGQLLSLSNAGLDWAKTSSYQSEVWVNKRNFQLTQLKLAGTYPINGSPVAFELLLGLSRHNDSLKIALPKASEELDLQHWLTNQGISF